MTVEHIDRNDIASGDIIRYRAIQEGNLRQHVKNRYFLVLHQDKDTLDLLPITHGYKKDDPYTAFNLKFADLLQKYMESKTGDLQQNYFKTAQNVHINREELKLKVQYIGSLSRFNDEFTNVKDKIKNLQNQILKRNKTYRKEVNSKEYQDPKKRKECLKSLRWIPTKILKKMAICEKLDLKPKYPHNMHPAIKPKKHKEKESDSPEIT